MVIGVGVNSQHRIVFSHGIGDSIKNHDETPGPSIRELYEADNIRASNGDLVDVRVDMVSFKGGLKGNKSITNRVVDHILQMQDALGVDFDANKITLSGISRGAYASLQAAVVLRRDHKIKVGAVVQITPVLNAVDFLENKRRRKHDSHNNFSSSPFSVEVTSDLDQIELTLLEGEDNDKEKLLTKSLQKAVLGTKVSLNKTTNLILHASTFQFSTMTPFMQTKLTDLEFIKDIPKYQFVGHKDIGINPSGIEKISKYADFVIHGHTARHATPPPIELMLKIAVERDPAQVFDINNLPPNVVDVSDKNSHIKMNVLLREPPLNPGAKRVEKFGKHLFYNHYDAISFQEINIKEPVETKDESEEDVLPLNYFFCSTWYLD